MWIRKLNKDGNTHFKNIVVTDLALGDHDELLVARLEASPTMTQSVFASLVKNRQHHDWAVTDLQVFTGTESTTLMVKPGLSRYTRKMAPDGSISIINLRFHKLHPEFLFGGDGGELSPWATSCMTLFPKLPYKDSWIPAIWEQAVKDGFIKKIPYCNFAVPVWQVVRNEAGWQRMITDMVQEGAFTS
jgi:hypothetical protein